MTRFPPVPPFCRYVLRELWQGAEICAKPLPCAEHSKGER